MSILDTMPAVTDAATAEAFIAWAVREIGLGFHPDNLGVDYTNRDGVRSFTDEEARRLDDAVTATFEFIDPYASAVTAVMAVQKAADLSSGSE